jgi:hypothetical protein
MIQQCLFAACYRILTEVDALAKTVRCLCQVQTSYERPDYPYYPGGEGDGTLESLFLFCVENPRSILMCAKVQRYWQGSAESQQSIMDCDRFCLFLILEGQKMPPTSGVAHRQRPGTRVRPMPSALCPRRP